MKAANVVLLTALAAIATATAAAPFSTDEARAEASQRNTAAARASALMPYEATGTKTIAVTDTESARNAATQANSRRAHEAHRAEVVSAGSGAAPTPVKVTDTDSARAAAAQQIRQQALKDEYAQYLQMQARGSANSITR